jgi:hypothetical protein
MPSADDLMRNASVMDKGKFKSDDDDFTSIKFSEDD